MRACLLLNGVVWAPERSQPKPTDPSASKAFLENGSAVWLDPWSLGVGHHGGVMMAAQQQNDAAPEACAGVSLQVLGVSVHGHGMEDGFLLPMDSMDAR